MIQMQKCALSGSLVDGAAAGLSTSSRRHSRLSTIVSAQLNKIMTVLPPSFSMVIRRASKNVPGDTSVTQQDKWRWREIFQWQATLTLQQRSMAPASSWKRSAEIRKSNPLVSNIVIQKSFGNHFALSLPLRLALEP